MKKVVNLLDSLLGEEVSVTSEIEYDEGVSYDPNTSCETTWIFIRVGEREIELVNSTTDFSNTFHVHEGQTTQREDWVTGVLRKKEREGATTFFVGENVIASFNPESPVFLDNKLFCLY